MSEVHHIEGTIERLGGNLSSYAFLRVPRDVVEQLPFKNRTRLLAIIDENVEIPCGLAGMGDGDYYFMLAKRNQKKLEKGPGDPVSYTVQQHPHPLGVEIPEVLEVLLAQDDDARRIWDGLTDGKKRSIIFGTVRIKNIDKQIEKITEWLHESLNRSAMSNRREFIKKSALMSAGGMLLTLPAVEAANTPQETGTGLYLIGPQKGFDPHIGTLLGTMTMMRTWVKNQVEDMSVKELDWQFDDQSNSIGAMLWHSAATEFYYQLNTIEAIPWGEWSEEIKAEWDLPMNLGEPARKKIKGYDIVFYFEKLDGVRADTERMFATLDDSWLWQLEVFFGNQPTNNYAKWFHVCEHESNHNGQIKFLKKRM